ncbi:MAG TPA: phenylalanine--tRNA ligase subunit beta [Vicinamibacterales bacterium]|nr:phenylalanine--tRNA ligase subunit beta [Vicinamibacterales bacterium]
MKISLEWIGDYVDLPADRTPAEMAHDLTMTTVEVEGVERLDEELGSLVAGKVTRRDGLQITLDVGSAGMPVTVSAREPIADGAMVAVSLAPEARLVAPADIGLAELLAGQSARAPLSLAGFDCKPGDSVAPLLGWTDVVFEIDNKSVTHRPDLWGHYGLARELGAIYRRPLKPLGGSPRNIPPGTLFGELDPVVCRRFTAAMIGGITPGEAPLWMRSRLWRVGQRPRNFFADLTNYVMLATGQPCHAYDAAKLSLPLSVRRAASGEKFDSLDGTTSVLTQSDFVVADTQGAVALAGVIGGAGSAISQSTENVLLEMASFDPVIVRKMAASTGLRTETSSRFEKGIATQRIDETRRLLFDIVQQVHPTATFTADDDRHIKDTVPGVIRADADYLCGRIGKDLSVAELSEPLERLGFKVKAHDRTLTVDVPDWRSTGDVSGPHDLVEEIARLHGYENFAFQPPVVRLHRTVRDYAAGTERRIKEFLAFTCGLQEVVNYPWIEDRYVNAGGNPALGEPLRLSAPPAPDQSTLRTSLIPGLLKAVAINLGWSADVRVFEAGVLYTAAGFAPLDDNRERLPAQRRAVAAALAGSDPTALFREAKGIVEALGRRAHVEAVRVEPIGTASGEAAPWADVSATALITSGAASVGSLGLLNGRASREAGVKRGYVALFEIDLDRLKPLASRSNTFKRLPVVPPFDIDVTLVYPDAVTWETIARMVVDVDPLIAEVQFVNEYRGDKIPKGHRSLSLRARLQADRTLTGEEASAVSAAIMAAAQETFGAQSR